MSCIRMSSLNHSDATAAGCFVVVTEGVLKREAPSADGAIDRAEAEGERERVLLCAVVLLRCAAWLYLASALCTLLIDVAMYYVYWDGRSHIYLGPSRQ